MSNIVLIGMPAAGKSAVGVILAKALGYDFIDTDILIQRREGRRLSEIIRDDGLDGFLAIEEAACLALTAERAVIATGGSVVYSEPAMAHLRRDGRTVYLDASFEDIAGRLQDIRGRGVVLREGQSLEALYRERAALYRRYADITVDERGLSLESTIQAVQAALSL